MQINPLWIMFALVFGGAGVTLIALDALMPGFLMCSGVLGWLFVANNTGQLFEDEDEEYEDD